MTTLTRPEQDQTVEKKIQQFRELFADAPEIGKKALENALHELKSQASDLPPAVESAGRVGSAIGVGGRGAEVVVRVSATGR